MDFYLPAFMRLLPFKRSVLLLLVHVAHTQNHDRSAITVRRTGILGLHTIFGACPVRVGGGQIWWCILRKVNKKQLKYGVGPFLG